MGILESTGDELLFQKYLAMFFARAIENPSAWFGDAAHFVEFCVIIVAGDVAGHDDIERFVREGQLLNCSIDYVDIVDT